MSLALVLGIGNVNAQTDAEDPATASPAEDDGPSARPYVIVGTIALCALGVLAIALYTRKKK